MHDFRCWFYRIRCLSASPSIAARPPKSELLLRAAPRRERAAVIYDALQRLTPAEREVLELCQKPRTTWETVAKALGISVTTAKSRYAAALDRAQLAALDVLAERLNETADEAHLHPDGMYEAA